MSRVTGGSRVLSRDILALPEPAPWAEMGTAVYTSGNLYPYHLAVTSSVGQLLVKALLW